MGAQRQVGAHPGLSLQLGVEAGALQPLHDPRYGEGEPAVRVQHRGATPLPAGGLLHRTAFAAAPRLANRRCQATAGAVPRGGGGRLESDASRKGSAPPVVTRAGRRAPRGPVWRRRRPPAAPSPLSPRGPHVVPRAGETAPVVPSAAALPRAPGGLPPARGPRAPRAGERLPKALVKTSRAASVS